MDVYPYKTYPMLCIGVCIAFTKPAIKSLLDQTNNTPLLHMDDVSIGLLAKAAGDIKFVNVFNWQYNLRKHLTPLRFHVIHTLAVKARDMEIAWRCLYTTTMDQHLCKSFKFW